MGLDGVELVMAVEDHFGITIKDAEAERIRIVGDLIAVTKSRVDATRGPICHTLPAFLSLRQLVREIVGDSAYSVRPRHLVTLSLSPRLRRQLWRRLPELLGTSPRALRHPSPFRIVLISGTVCAFLCALLPAAFDARIVPLTIAVAGACVYGLLLATDPWRIVPPDGWKTMGDIAQQVASTTTAPASLMSKSEATIFEELRPIVAEQLGVDLDEVVREARLVEDLGMS